MSFNISLNRRPDSSVKCCRDCRFLDIIESNWCESRERKKRLGGPGWHAPFRNDCEFWAPAPVRYTLWFRIKRFLKPDSLVR